MRLSLCTAFAAAALASGAAEFNPGGTTFDFAQISNQRFKAEPGGKNLLGEKWEKPYFWGKHTPEQRAKIRHLILFSSKKSESGTVLKIVNPAATEEISIGEAAKIPIQCKWRQKFALPDQEGGSYRVSCRYRSLLLGKRASYGYIVFYFYGSGSKPMSRPILTKTLPFTGGEWQQYSSPVEVPAGTETIEIYFRLDGSGEIEFDNPCFEKTPVSYPASVLMLPHGLIDDTFALSQNDPALLALAWKRNIAKTEWARVQNPRLHVALPPEVVFKESFPMPLVESRDGTYVFALDALKDSLADRSDYYSSVGSLMWLRLTTGAAPETRLADASYWLTDGDKPISARKTIRFIVIPSIPAADKPNLFLPGFLQFAGYCCNLNEEDWARFVGKTGMRWVHAYWTSRKLLRLYRKYGVARITPSVAWIANGFRVGTPKNKPEYAKFKFIRQPAPRLARYTADATCPAAIYNKTDYFKNNVVPYLREKLGDGVDGLLANWEPFMFIGLGCYCDQCRDEFAAYAKLSPEEAKKIWRQGVTAGHKYYDIYTKFRGWQHARMIRTLHEAISKSSTGKTGFVPEIVWYHLTDSKNKVSCSDEYDPLCYAGYLKYLVAWGPYIYWNAEEPYIYEKGVYLHSYVAGRLVMDYLRKHLPAEKIPEMTAFPQGFQGGSWVVNPEAVAMEHTSYFLSGYGASIIYQFPAGYDNRYWAALAAANDLIAKHEKTVRLGKKSAAVTVEPRTPYPAPKGRINYLQFNNELPAESLLQVKAFQKDGVLLAAVGNFWEKGEVFFTLKAAGLPVNGRFVVLERDKKRAFTARGKTGFTSTELAQGVLLHAGALRWAFFEIVPEDRARDGVELIEPDEVKKAMAKRFGKLKKEAAEEAVRDAAESQKFRKSELKPLSCDRLRCQPVQAGCANQYIDFTAGNNSLRLALNGMVIKSWKINGTELVDGTGTCGLGNPAFLQPGFISFDPFFVVGQRRTTNGISITAERRLDRRDAMALEHLLIRQTVGIGKNLEHVVIRTELINGNNAESGMSDITLGFRYHNFPLCLGDGGSIEMPTPEGKLDFKRKQQGPLVLTRARNAYSLKVNKSFNARKAPVGISGNRAVWKTGNGKIKVRTVLEPAEKFAGYACWDTPAMKTPTFEPFFLPVTITAGKLVTYGMKLDIGQ